MLVIKMMEEAYVEILNCFILNNGEDPIHYIVHTIYHELFNNFGNIEYFKDIAILTPTLDVVSSVNEYMISTLPSEERIYLSSNSILKVDESLGIQVDWLTTKFLK